MINTAQPRAVQKQWSKLSKYKQHQVLASVTLFGYYKRF